MRQPPIIGQSPILGILFLVFAAGCFGLTISLSRARLVKPPVNLSKPDFSQIEDIDARKQAFFDFLTPMFEDQNRRILQVRERLLAIRDEFSEHGKLSERSQHYVKQLTQTYYLDEEELTTEEQITRLIRRVGIIPLPLALAQAASESGWGSSRFAVSANNFFGQWCYEEGCGLVPNRRIAGAQHEVAAFDSVRDSITAYFLNINTHDAYRDFRQRRQQIRASGRRPRSEDLIPTLINYSERREAYLSDLRQIIHANKLNRLEQSE